MFPDEARYWTHKDIEKITRNNITEYKYLEFKSLGALVPEAKDEISKDVSSFANSAGGVIVYGIKEVKDGLSVQLELEEGVDAASPRGKEWLENVIVSRISPKIEGLYINPVKLTNDRYVFAVVIPKSNTAHMAGNNRYYKRYNFKVEPMEDYEVRDIMNRMNIPVLRLSFTAPKKAASDGAYPLQLVVMNTGESFVRHFAIRVCLPESIIRGDMKGGRRLLLEGKVYREYIKQSNPNQYIFPGFKTFLDPRFLPVLDAEASRTQAQSFLYWTIYTDKGSPVTDKTQLAVVIRDRIK